MTISATVAIADMDTANAELEELGHGPSNFSVPLRTGTAEATHGGLHAWDDTAFLTSLQSLSVPVTIRNEPGQTVNFGDHVQAEALEWSDPTEWFENPVMTGDQRTYDGKTWESLTDYNVWAPPVGWREVVTDGVAAWVQPTGSQDAYATGDLVTHDNPNDGGAIWVYQSNIDANTAEPGRDGTFDRWWEPLSLETDYVAQ